MGNANKAIVNVQCVLYVEGGASTVLALVRMKSDWAPADQPFEGLCKGDRPTFKILWWVTTIKVFDVGPR